MLHVVPVLMERRAIPLPEIRPTLPVALVAVGDLIVEGGGGGRVVGGDADGGDVGGDLHLR